MYQRDSQDHRCRLPTAVAAAGLVLGSCVFAPPTTVPLPTIPAEIVRNTQDTLVVMLPGRGDRMDRFLDTGFVTDTDGADFDIVLTDAHWGYYRDRTMTRRLHEDVILPAKSEGYEEIWLLGISMGGLGAVLYASEFPGNVDGVVLIAPFLGERRLIEEITDAGGLEAWPGESPDAADYEVAAWRWLQTAVDDPTRAIVLAYGTEDRLADSYAPLVEALPQSRIFSRPGGHQWSTWTPLWRAVREADLIGPNAGGR